MPRNETAVPKKAYVHQSFPAWRHHATKESKLVANAQQSETETPDEDGWVDDPALLGPAPKADPTIVATPAPDAAAMTAAFDISWNRLSAENRELLSKNHQLQMERDAALTDADALRISRDALKSELEALKASKSSQFKKAAPAAPTTEPVTGAAE